MPRLIVATHNSHKTEEIRQMIGDAFEEVLDLTAFPEAPEPEETGETFEENAKIKALSASARLPEDVVLADDSGLEVDALGGAPGVYSARYSGREATDESNRVKVLGELEKAGIPAGDAGRRRARFRCVLVLASGGAVREIHEGAVEGHIAPEARGAGGFGYDPVFIPEGYGETFGELAPEVKNSMSHRGRALAKLKASLEKGENDA